MKRRVTLGSDGTEGNWVLMIGVKVGRYTVSHLLRSFPFEGRRLELHLPPSLTLPLPTHLQLPVSSAFQILPDILINKNSYLFLLLTPQLPHILFPQLPLLPLLAQRRVAETLVLLAVGFLAGAEYCPSEPTLPRVLAHEIVHVFARACSNLCQHAFLSLSSFVRTPSICSAPILLILFNFCVFPAFGTPEVTVLLLEALGTALPFQANLSGSQCANAMHSSAFFLIDASAVMGYSVFLPNFLTFLIGLLGLNDAGRVGGEMRQMGWQFFGKKYMILWLLYLML